MRHGKKDNHLGRTASHRRAMLSNMASSLILHKRIETTLAKAKELRKYVEPLLTRSKVDSTHNRRIVFSYLHDKESVKELFNVVSDKIVDRPGGYTRIVKLGTRLGDAAETCLMELVDFNETLLLAETEKATKTRRSRRGGKKSETSTADDAQAAPVALEETAAPEADDLEKVEGVGPKIAEVLQAAGIDSFAKLAETTPEAIREILDNAGSQFASHDPATWPKQAELAAAGQWEELKTWQDELNGGREN
ncbi:50S ribosomal protein L17 [Arundinibacter roseus]|uniref:Large ribosomal subunit protein bL17 n=1 Tax=Arundinibacter roseus TaxID=2070510 RepID=A0A4R4KKK8_9BACT|nr:50S ribosomal protein L17 [Arundinibacter roseus]TDB68787.1 50S ribosomal protein L17 [Arundinibacter roseus]